VFFLAGILLVAVSGCQGNKTKAVGGGVIVGVLGATAGGVIGHQSRHGLEGSAIGAAVGAVAGSVIGSQIEKEPKVSDSKSAGGTSVYQREEASLTLPEEN
jgi:uncharacterized protein YcfJ